MKEAIGGTWLFQIVIVFILMFAGYMCLSINHSKAFGIKSEIIESLTRHAGVDKKEIKEILHKASYRTKGSCDRVKSNDSEKWEGYNREGERDDNNATFCIRKIAINTNNYNMFYYQVRVFYQLDLPIFNSLFSFTVKGDTTLLTNSNSGGVSR